MSPSMAFSAPAPGAVLTTGISLGLRVDMDLPSARWDTANHSTLLPPSLHLLPKARAVGSAYVPARDRDQGEEQLAQN